MSDLRVGRISALNMFPVYHHLEQAHLPGVTFTDGLPSRLNAAMLDGSLDVSAMSSIAYARNADRLRLLPVGCIACEGAVDSIRLFSQVPIDQVTRVAVTPHSASSVTLLRVLLGPDVPFRVLAHDDDAPDAIAAGEAVLLIADAALLAHRDGLARHSIDLGEAWQQRTGLPMVFAVWAVRDDAAVSRMSEVATLCTAIADAGHAFRDDPTGIAHVAAERFPFDEHYIRGYLQHLRYGFADAERAGLARFLELARRAGELQDVPALEALAA